MKRIRFPFLPALLAVFALGCSDSDDSSSDNGSDETPAACEEFRGICHEADDGSNDLATECHHVAHMNDEADCAERQQECLTFCTQKVEDGGGHGAAGAGHGGAGHHHH